MHQNSHYNIDKNDKNILQNLASHVAELANRPIEAEKQNLWYRHNALEETRPLIFCDPENGWNEIITQDDLKCQTTLTRIWEMYLRREIFYGKSLCDDRVILPYFDVSHVFTQSDWGMKATNIGVDKAGSYIWDPPLKSYKDMDKLHFPKTQVDNVATQRRLDQAMDIFDGILKVRLRTTTDFPPFFFWTTSKISLNVWWWSLGLTHVLTRLRGLEQINYDFFDHPKELHQLMAFLRDGYHEIIDYVQNNNLLSLNNDGTYVGSGGFGWTTQLPQADYQGRVRTQDMWGFAESQETQGISPEMFAEFVFPYQISLLERFGLNSYGCCEPLDKRWKYVKKIPRLRRVSISPWSNISTMAEKLESKYVFSLKANPVDLVLPSFDENQIRKKVRKMLKQTRRCRVELIMKDNHTILNDPSRVVRWVKIALEEAKSL